ncbi:MAG: DUF937 domain-containing protein [bacterium]
MDLLKTIMAAQGGASIDQIAQKLGLDKSAVEGVMGAIAPALGKGIANNTQAAGGLDSLLGALQKGNHQRYIEDPALAVDDSGIAEGNKILGHILGNKDVSRQVASRAAEQTGVSDSLIKQMLPMLATMAMGALSQKKAQAPAGDTDLGGLLGAFLGGGDNNSMVDDLLGMAGKFLK